MNCVTTIISQAQNKPPIKIPVQVPNEVMNIFYKIGIMSAIVIVICIILVIILAILIKKKREHKHKNQKIERENVFVKRKFMTASEIKFYYTLKNILPEMNVLCQVSLGALLENATNRWERGYFNQKIADFVIADQNMKVIAIIELDDPSHDAKGRREKDEKRDAMLQSAGYRTLRYDGRMLPEEEEIRYDIIAA